MLNDLKVFCRIGNVTGTRYLAGPGYHFTERWFWLLSLLLGVGYALFLMFSYFYMFDITAYAMVIAKPDGRVNFTKSLDFPAIAVCELSTWQNTEFALDFQHSDQYPMTSVAPVFRDFVRAFVYQEDEEGTAIFRFWKHTQHVNSEEAINYAQLDLTELPGKIIRNCSEVLLHCTWRDRPFDCCSYFRPTRSMVGHCFEMQPPHTDDLNMKLEAFSYKHHGHLNITFGRPVEIHLMAHNSAPRPYSPWQTSPSGRLGMHTAIQFSVQPYANDLDVLQLPHEVLQCWPEPVGRKEFTVCLQDCIRRRQIAACKCVSWNLQDDQSDGQPCQLLGYVCLEQAGLFSVKQIWRNLLSQCGCLLSCSQVDLVIDGVKVLPQMSNASSSACLSLRTFPKLVLRRQLLRRELDSVMSFGGIISLCVGCSFMSLLELLFITLHRLCHGNYITG